MVADQVALSGMGLYGGRSHIVHNTQVGFNTGPLGSGDSRVWWGKETEKRRGMEGNIVKTKRERSGRRMVKKGRSSIGRSLATILRSVPFGFCLLLQRNLPVFQLVFLSYSCREISSDLRVVVTQSLLLMRVWYLEPKLSQSTRPREFIDRRIVLFLYYLVTTFADQRNSLKKKNF